MSKLDLKVTINNKETDFSYEVQGTIEDNILEYLEEDNTKVSFNYANNHLTRINNEFRMDYTFDLEKETNGTIKILEMDRTISINIKTNKIERKNNNILIEYSIDDDKFIYRIEVIE